MTLSFMYYNFFFPLPYRQGLDLAWKVVKTESKRAADTVIDVLEPYEQKMKRIYTNNIAKVAATTTETEDWLELRDRALKDLDEKKVGRG